MVTLKMGTENDVQLSRKVKEITQTKPRLGVRIYALLMFVFLYLGITELDLKTGLSLASWGCKETTSYSKRSVRRYLVSCRVHFKFRLSLLFRRN